MYETRLLTTEQQLYVDKCQEKIAELGAELANEAEINDVSYEKHQMARELQYSIETLKSSFITSQDEDDIERMISYYTIVAELWEFSGRTGQWAPPPSLPGSGYVSQSQFNDYVDSSSAEDLAIRDDLSQEQTAREDGDADLQAQIDILADGAASATTDVIVAGMSVGGIPIGTVYPVGTTFQSIFEELLGVVDKITNFTFSSYGSLKEVGSTVTPSQFTWVNVGFPENLVITDNQGNSVAVSDSPQTVGWSYSPASPTTISWTINGDNVSPVTKQTKFVYPTYHGVMSATDNTPIDVTTSMFAGASKTVQDSASGSVTCSFSVSATQQGWIAVPKVQTNGNFTKWLVNADNAGFIGTGFIIGPVDLNYDGVVYQVYQWGYRSPLTNSLRLYR